MTVFVKKLASYENEAWNIRAVAEATHRGFQVRVEPINSTPYFLNQPPKEFSTREAAIETARVIAGR